MYYLDTLMIQYKDDELMGIFEYQKDCELKNNLLERRGEFSQLPFMESQVKAMMQTYVEGMKKNALTADKSLSK